MKRTLQSLAVVLGLMTLGSAQAQVRYLDQIFDEHIRQDDVQIGFNVDALRSAFTDAAFSTDMAAMNAIMAGGAIPPMKYFQSNGALPAEDHTSAKLFPITMDIYTPPTSDTAEARPVIIYIHTGNFLPPIINGGPTGSKRDSAAVNLCKQWARSGYVVASLDYRMGWNPISTDEDVRRGTLLQAVYRAMHDTQTAVRFMRATAIAQGNPYKIDESKIALFGQGSGGYVVQAYATLDDYDTDVAIEKFIGENGQPYVIEARDGDINGGPGGARLPDLLQVAGFSKDISLAMNIGGAMADIGWLDAGDVPMISLHCVRDPFAPFGDGTVVVPTTNEDVVDVSGANVFIQKAVDLGVNAMFTTIPDGDPFTDRARSLYGQTFDYILASEPTITIAPNPEGLFPIVLPINTLGDNRFTNQGAPWDWYDYATLEMVVAGTNAALGLTGTPEAYSAATINAQTVAGSPGMGPEKGLAYIDTIQGYVNPRMMCVFELEGAPCVSPNTGISKIESQDNTTIFPNPAQSSITIRNTEEVIRRIQLIDITGRVVLEKNVNDHTYRLERGQLNDGVYLMQIIFDSQQITKKVLFN